MKRVMLFIIIGLAIITLAFLLGPKAKFPKLIMDTVPKISLEDVEQKLKERESLVSDIREGNGAQIIWADSSHQKTAYSVVYLHGFSASHEEGMPIHVNFAKRYGCNLFLPRFHGHGRLDTSAFETLTPQEMLESSEFAIEVGKALGDKIILINCSSGATTGLFLASGDNSIAGIINYSPNIDIYGEMDEMLLMPWGKQIARKVFKGDYNHIKYTEEQAKYWNDTYHINGLISLKYLINNTMTPEVFQGITQPVFLAYFYKDEENQDKVVSVESMLDFYKLISTPEEKKRKIVYPNGRHVMSSHIIPCEATEQLEIDTYSFAEEILGLKKRN